MRACENLILIFKRRYFETLPRDFRSARFGNNNNARVILFQRHELQQRIHVERSYDDDERQTLDKKFRGRPQRKLHGGRSNSYARRTRVENAQKRNGKVEVFHGMFYYVVDTELFIYAIDVRIRSISVVEHETFT